MNISNMPGPGDAATWPTPQWDGESTPFYGDAREHLLACPDDWSLWLADQPQWPGEGRACAVDYVGEDMTRVGTVTLFAVLLAGNSEQCLRARHELRERFVRDNAQRIAEIAEDMIRAEVEDWETRHAGEEY